MSGSPWPRAIAGSIAVIALGYGIMKGVCAMPADILRVSHRSRAQIVVLTLSLFNSLQAQLQRTSNFTT